MGGSLPFFSHKIALDDEPHENDDMIVLHGFLDGEYGKSMLSVDYQPVSYLRSVSYQQVGLFAKIEFTKGSVINGVIGFLAEIEENEIVEDYNDVSIIYSKLKGVQWLMIGPISFVNASCRANVEYKHKGRLIYCTAIRDIKVGEELTVFYSRHFFGNFNKDCLCQYKSEHGNPFPCDPEPPKKRQKVESNLLVSTPINNNGVSRVSVTPNRRILVDKLPTRRALYEISRKNDSDAGDSLVSYDSFFGQLVISPVKCNTPSLIHLDSPSSNSMNEANITDQSDPVVANPLSSTPIRLDLIEAEKDPPNPYEDNKFPFPIFQEEGTPLFAGATSSTDNFMTEFDMICDKHKFSKIGREDILKLFAKSLPDPNNLFTKLSVPFLPTISSFACENAKLCFVDIKSQIEKILEKNLEYILSSWSGSCSWQTSRDFFEKPEVQLVLNKLMEHLLDGACC